MSEINIADLIAGYGPFTGTLPDRIKAALAAAEARGYKKAIAVIARRLREPDEELTELFVDHRDDSFGWRKFYLELASHLERQK